MITFHWMRPEPGKSHSIFITPRSNGKHFYFTCNQVVGFAAVVFSMHTTVSSKYIIGSFSLGYLTYLNINLLFTYNVTALIIILPSHSVPIKTL